MSQAHTPQAVHSSALCALPALLAQARRQRVRHVPPASFRMVCADSARLLACTKTWHSGQYSLRARTVPATIMCSVIAPRVLRVLQAEVQVARRVLLDGLARTRMARALKCASRASIQTRDPRPAPPVSQAKRVPPRRAARRWFHAQRATTHLRGLCHAPSARLVITVPPPRRCPLLARWASLPLRVKHHALRAQV